MSKSFFIIASLLLVLSHKTGAAESTNSVTTNVTSTVSTNAASTNAVTSSSRSRSESDSYRSSRSSRSSRTTSFSRSNESTNSTETGFGAFRLISERNIFNPNRRPRVSFSSAPPPRPRQTDTFSLRGTMSYENVTNAIFEGTSSRYRGTLSPGDKIANYTVVAVGTDFVSLGASSNQTLLLRVGMQMTRSDDGPWQLIGSSEAALASVDTPTAPDTATDSTSTSSTSSTTSSGSSDASDVLKRLMERRAKEK